MLVAYTLYQQTYLFLTYSVVNQSRDLSFHYFFVVLFRIVSSFSFLFITILAIGGYTVTIRKSYNSRSYTLPYSFPTVFGFLVTASHSGSLLPGDVSRCCYNGNCPICSQYFNLAKNKSRVLFHHS